MDEQAILDILGGEGTDAEKAKKLLDAHKTDKAPLEKAKETILAEKKALQEKLEKLSGEAAAEREAGESRIKELEGEIGKAGGEEAKKAFDAQLERKAREFEAREKKLTEELSESKGRHDALLERRRLDMVGLDLENAMTKLGITDPDDRDNCRDKFMRGHGGDFKPNGEDRLENAEYKTVSEVLSRLATDSTAYQKFIPARNGGGGASGSSGAKPSSANPFEKGRENLTEQGRLFRENNALYERLRAEAASKGG